MAIIKVSERLLRELRKRRIQKTDTYEEIIQDLIEQRLSLSRETLQEIERAREEFAQGRGIPMADVRRRLGL